MKAQGVTSFCAREALSQLSPKKQLEKPPHCLYHLCVPFQQSLTTLEVLFLQELSYLYMGVLREVSMWAMEGAEVIAQALLGEAETSAGEAPGWAFLPDLVSSLDFWESFAENQEWGWAKGMGNTEENVFVSLTVGEGCALTDCL